jgi:hypothetical protein
MSDPDYMDLRGRSDESPFDLDGTGTSEDVIGNFSP